jgi:hypothetical protein
VLHRVFFAPGMFGFGRLASFDYFVHLERAVAERFRAAGLQVETYVADVQPTASIRRRAAQLNELVAGTFAASDAPARVHLVGHSTGGLDARLVASPSARLPVPPRARAWLPHLASVTTMNAPHHGTPLAAFFATVSGQRVLYAVSALTFIGLSLGAPPLAAASAVVVAITRLDGAVGLELRVLDRATDALLRVLDDARSREVRQYLDAIQKDQGAVIQVTPEAMDLFQAGVEDREGVRYQCIATMAPAPSARGILSQVLSPWGAISASLFTTFYGLTARADANYPCAAPRADDATEAMLDRAFGKAPGVRVNDGVVPLRSQLWGELVWTGHADHLDVLGHFGETEAEAGAGPRHSDWLRSGSGFDRVRFEAMVDALVRRLVSA